MISCCTHYQHNDILKQYLLLCIFIKLIERNNFSFNSSNSSFTECTRKRSLNNNSNNKKPKSNNINPQCSHYTTEGKCIYNTQSVTLSDGQEHTFTDSEFIRCHHSGCGGAIDQTGGGTLIIKRCVFDTCSCTDRGGAVSFRRVGTCIQEDNLYTHCTSTEYTGGFNSYEIWNNVVHNHKRCTYIDSQAPYYGHFCIEFAEDAVIESNIHIHGRSDGSLHAGTVVNYQAQGAIVHSNSLFVDGKAYNSGGLSFLGEYTSGSASLSVKFCFFFNNYATDNSAKEIYFDGNTTSRACKDLIIHSFTSTPNSKVFVPSDNPQDQDWLPLTIFHFFLS